MTTNIPVYGTNNFEIVAAAREIRTEIEKLAQSDKYKTAWSED